MEELGTRNKAQLEILKENKPFININPEDFEISAWKNSKEIVMKFKKYENSVSLNTQPYAVTIKLITKQVLFSSEPVNEEGEENDFEILQMTQKEIIERAVVLLKEKQPKLEINFPDYNILVLDNSRETQVKFKRIIKYIPQGTDPEKRFSYDIIVNIMTDEISPFEDYFESEFYIETKKDKEAIAFIKKHFGSFSAGFENTVREGEKNYFIDCENQYSYGKYVLDKKTGKQGPSIQTSYEHMAKPNVMDDLDFFIEIK